MGPPGRPPCAGLETPGNPARRTPTSHRLSPPQLARAQHPELVSQLVPLRHPPRSPPRHGRRGWPPLGPFEQFADNPPATNCRTNTTGCPRLTEVEVPVLVWSGWYDNILTRNPASLAGAGGKPPRPRRPAPPHPRPHGPREQQRLRRNGRPHPRPGRRPHVGPRPAVHRRRPRPEGRRPHTRREQRTGRAQDQRLCHRRRPLAPRYRLAPCRNDCQAPAPLPTHGCWLRCLLSAIPNTDLDPDDPLDFWEGKDLWALSTSLTDRRPLHRRPDVLTHASKPLPEHTDEPPRVR
jgi:hypothetical protein